MFPSWGLRLPLRRRIREGRAQSLKKNKLEKIKTPTIPANFQFLKFQTDVFAEVETSSYHTYNGDYGRYAGGI